MINRDLVTAGEFYGEEGVQRRVPLVRNAKGFLDGDYDRSNPDGMAWGRRNYLGTVYQSGTPSLEPGEYRVRADFYRQYRLDEERSP